MAILQKPFPRIYLKSSVSNSNPLSNNSFGLPFDLYSLALLGGVSVCRHYLDSMILPTKMRTIFKRLFVALADSSLGLWDLELHIKNSCFSPLIHQIVNPSSQEEPVRRFAAIY